MIRVTRKEAAARLNVSKSTLDRMIKRGELTTETEQHGQRHTVWVIMDDDIEDTAAVSTGVRLMATSLKPVSTPETTPPPRILPSRPR